MADLQARKLANEHWAWLVVWLEMVYKDALIHGYKHGWDDLMEAQRNADEKALKELVEGEYEAIAKIIYYFDNRGLAYDIPKWESMPDHLQKPYWDKAGQIIKLILEE